MSSNLYLGARPSAWVAALGRGGPDVTLGTEPSAKFPDKSPKVVALTADKTASDAQ